jgi:hypothetical protein
MADEIRIKVLKDGSVRINTDTISEANHGNAEALLSDIMTRMGGDMERVEKEGHTHSHEHGINHTH